MTTGTGTISGCQIKQGRSYFNSPAMLLVTVIALPMTK
jgi:hypothetical protein